LLGLTDELMHDPVVVMFRPAVSEGDGSDEHREEAVSVREFGDAVRDEYRSQRDMALGRLGESDEAPRRVDPMRASTRPAANPTVTPMTTRTTRSSSTQPRIHAPPSLAPPAAVDPASAIDA
jgi:hypothetical protein